MTVSALIGTTEKEVLGISPYASRKRARTFETRVSQILNKRVAPNKKVLKYAIQVMNENKARFQTDTNPAGGHLTFKK